MDKDSIGIDDSWEGDMSIMKKIITFIICILVPVMVGILSGWLTRANMDGYETVYKPALTPPGTVFFIAWSILYVLMGMASYFAIINCTDTMHKITVLLPYIVQLILNFCWSLIFFNIGNYGLALACLVLMWILIIRTMISFASVSMLSVCLLVPYIVWVTFAGYLNLMIFLHR